MEKEHFMRLALKEAQTAAKKGEVPVGALVVDLKTSEVIARAHNLKESTHDPCGHAEVLALRDAAKKMASWRLNNLSLFVTLEPCMMCCGALIHARLKSIHYGAKDLKAGFVNSLEQGLDKYPLNHNCTWEGGLLEKDCSQILKDFFKEKRKK